MVWSAISLRPTRRRCGTITIVKYDILGLKNIEIVKDAYALLGKPYPQSHEIDWDDKAVWADMLRSPAGIFQFEGDFAFTMLRQYKPGNIFDMSLVTAALRPSGASYRDALIQHKPNRNPSPIIDELLKDNNGYLIYQEDVIKFLQEICGFSGSDADNTRRAVARKDEERLKRALPQIMEGYCVKSPQPRPVAEKEARTFLQIIEDASSYMFGYNHSIGYCMLGYLCAYLRYYHPAEFIVAYLNNAANEDDIKSGSDLASLYKVRIVPPCFGISKDKYVFDKVEGVIAKGIASVKYLSAVVAQELYALAARGRPDSFMVLLTLMVQHTCLDTRQRDILIKIGFFSGYGNSSELLRMVQLFVFFKEGTAKRISKEALTASPELETLVAAHGKDQNKDGAVGRSYLITDMSGLLRDCEFAVRALHLPAPDIKAQIQTQLDYMGYADVTSNRPEDRRKLLVQEVYPLWNKEHTEAWGYVIQTRSIGSGKTARLTVRSRLFKRAPIKQGDIVFAKGLEPRRGYWYLIDFDLIA